MNPTINKTTDDYEAQELEQQLFELVYGLLEPAEAQAMRRRVTSEPEVARAYARVVQQSERLAVAAQWEEPPLPLAAMLEAAGRLVDEEEAVEIAPRTIAGGKPAAGVERSETPKAPAVTANVTLESQASTKTSTEITPAPQPARWDRWLAALAGGLVAAAVVIAACIVSPNGDPRGIANNPVQLMLGVPTTIAPEQSTVAFVSGSPSEKFSYTVRGRDGRLYEEGKGALSSSGNGSLNISVPGDAEGPVTLNVTAAHASATEATIGLAAEAAPVTAAVEFEHGLYVSRDVVRASIRAVGAKDLPADTRLVAKDQRGMVLQAEGGIVNGVGSYEFKLPANAVPGRYLAWAEGENGYALGFNNFYVEEELREQDQKLDDAVAVTGRGEGFGRAGGYGMGAGGGGERYAHPGSGGSGFGLEGTLRGVAPLATTGVREEPRRSGTELASDSKSGSKDSDLIQPLDEQIAPDGALLLKRPEALGKGIVVVVEQGDRRLVSRAIEPEEAKGEKDNRGPIEIPLPATASGKMRFKVYDTDGESPRLLGEHAIERAKEATFTATISPVLFQSGDALFDIDIRDKEGRPLGETRFGARVQFLPLDGRMAGEVKQLDDLARPELAVKEELEVERLKHRWYFPEVAEAFKSPEEALLVEDQTSPVSFRRKSELLTTYRRRFPAGGSPPSMILDGDSVRFVQPTDISQTEYAEQDKLAKARYLRGDKLSERVDQLKQLTEITATSEPQIVSSLGVLEQEELDGTVPANEAKSLKLDDFARQTAPTTAPWATWPWAAIFAGLGGGVIVLAGGVALVRRPDPWLVWLPAGMVTVACLAATLWVGSRLNSTTMATGGAESAPLVVPQATPSPDPSFAVPVNPVRAVSEGQPELETLAELPPLLSFGAGDEPSNEKLEKFLGNDASAKLPAPREPAGQADVSPPADPASVDRPLQVPETRPVVPAGGPQPLPEAKPPEIANGPLLLPIIQGHPAGSGVQPMGEIPTYEYGTNRGLGGQTYGLARESGREQTLLWKPAAATDANGRARLVTHRPPGPGYYKLRVTADRNGESVTTERIIKVEK